MGSEALVLLAVFPAHAGMSPLMSLMTRTFQGFPRSRGDEPWLLEAQRG